MQESTSFVTFPLDAIVFDCDGTLSKIEGIDYLAEQNGAGIQVKELTELAMSETGITPDLYKKRISLVKPSRKQLILAGQEYFYQRSQDLDSVIQIFKNLSKELFIISAGLNPAVKIFAALLGIPESNVFAVDIKFNEEGNYLNYDHQSPMTSRNGKRKVIEELKKSYPNILHVGDGMNDYEAHDVVSRFVGYGGAAYRIHMEQLCEFYIKSASLLPLLALALTEKEFDILSDTDKNFYQQGLNYIINGEVKVPVAIVNS